MITNLTFKGKPPVAFKSSQNISNEEKPKLYYSTSQMAEDYYPDKKLAKDLNKIVNQLERADQETIQGIQKLIINEEPLTAETKQKIDELLKKSKNLSPTEKKSLKEAVYKTIENIEDCPKILKKLLQTTNPNSKMSCMALGAIILFFSLTSGVAAAEISPFIFLASFLMISAMEKFSKKDKDKEDIAIGVA